MQAGYLERTRRAARWVGEGYSTEFLEYSLEFLSASLTGYAQSLKYEQIGVFKLLGFLCCLLVSG